MADKDKQITCPKPAFLIAPGTMSKRDIRRLERLCSVVVVECKDTSHARFLESPIALDADTQAKAALQLWRFILGHSDSSFYKTTLTKWFVDIIMSDQERPKEIQKVKR